MHIVSTKRDFLSDDNSFSKYFTSALNTFAAYILMMRKCTLTLNKLACGSLYESALVSEIPLHNNFNIT